MKFLVKIALFSLVCFLSLSNVDADIDSAKLRARGLYRLPRQGETHVPQRPSGVSLPVPDLPRGANNQSSQFRQLVARYVDTPIQPLRPSADIPFGKMNVRPTLNNSVPLGPYNASNPNQPWQCPLDPMTACGRQDRYLVVCTAPANASYPNSQLFPWHDIPPAILYSGYFDFTPWKMYKWDGVNVVCDTSDDVQRQPMIYVGGCTEFDGSFFNVFQPAAANPDLQTPALIAEIDVTCYIDIPGWVSWYPASNADRWDQAAWIEDWARANYKDLGLPRDVNFDRYTGPRIAGGQSMGGVTAINLANGNVNENRPKSPYNNSFTFIHDGSGWYFGDDPSLGGGNNRFNSPLVQFLGQTLATEGWAGLRAYNVETVKNYALQSIDACDPGYTTLVFWGQILPYLQAHLPEWSYWVHPAPGHYPPSIYWANATTIFGDAMYISTYVIWGGIGYWAYNLPAYAPFVDPRNIANLPGFSQGTFIPGGNYAACAYNLDLIAQDVQAPVYSFSSTKRQESSVASYSSLILPDAVFWMNFIRVKGRLVPTISNTEEQIRRANMSAPNYYPGGAPPQFGC